MLGGHVEVQVFEGDIVVSWGRIRVEAADVWRGAVRACISPWASRITLYVYRIAGASIIINK